MIQRIIARTTPESKAHVGLLMSPFANMALETNIPQDLSIFLDYIKCNSISSQLFWLSILKRPRSMGMSGVSDGWIMAFFASLVGFGAWAEEKGACLQDTSLGLLSVEDASLFSVSFSLPVVSSPCCFTKWWRWSISCLRNPLCVSSLILKSFVMQTTHYQMVGGRTQPQRLHSPKSFFPSSLLSPFYTDEK